MKKILVINGSNLNFVGIREKDVYGSESYESLCEYIKDYEYTEKIDVSILHSNHEGDIVDFIQKAYYDKVDGIVINPGAYTHYSYSIYDAIKSVPIPTVEVHLSDLSTREDFRKVSVIKDACVKQIGGKGKAGYIEALEFLINYKK